MRPIALLSLIGLAACIPTRQRLYGDPVNGTGTIPPSVSKVSQTKIVSEKDDPATLISQDGATCAVTPDRYAKILIGDRVLCTWQGGRQRTPYRSIVGGTAPRPR